MKHLRKLNESFELINKDILDEMEYIREFLEDLEENGFRSYKSDVVNVNIRLGSGFGGGLQSQMFKTLEDFSKWIKNNLSEKINSYTYNVSCEINKVEDTSYIRDIVNSLLDRLKNTNCRVQNLSITTEKHYSMQYQRMSNTRKNQIGQKYQDGYLTKEVEDCKVNISIVNPSDRYNINF